jgi:16S rRNA (guanine(966)-N(2))-methyltransferase RsmD
MRIITGKYKGKTIKMPKGIRPTQNKVRKALFDILGDLEGLSFLELFAGSGAVGFEAVSLGVADLTLVEYNRDCLLAIKKNIESLKLKACSFYPKEAAEAIKTLFKEAKKFDIIFMDPPYYQNKIPRLRSGLAATSDYDSLAKKTLQTLTRYDILAPNGFIVVQHFKKDNLPDTLGDLILFKQSKYGDTLLSFYKKKAKD